MSTLTTRIAGYKFTMRPATGEEIASHRQTSYEQGWAFCPDYSRAMVGNFVSETGNVMDLPYELRCTRMLVSPEMMLSIFAADAEDLRERVLDASAFCECYRSAKTCENCKIDTALMSRLYSIGRGNSWRTKAHAANGRSLF